MRLQIPVFFLFIRLGRPEADKDHFLQKHSYLMVFTSLQRGNNSLTGIV